MGEGGCSLTLAHGFQLYYCGQIITVGRDLITMWFKCKRQPLETTFPVSRRLSHPSNPSSHPLVMDFLFDKVLITALLKCSLPAFHSPAHRQLLPLQQRISVCPLLLQFLLIIQRSITAWTDVDLLHKNCTNCARNTFSHAVIQLL